MKKFAIIVLAYLCIPLAWAQETQQQSVNPDRFYNLTSELRCLVCQNESLADSNAPLAIDLKNEIHSRMAQGQSDAQIKQFLVDRYGNFVIYRPPFDATTLGLWLGPLILVGIGFFALWRNHKLASAQAPSPSDDPNSPADEEGSPINDSPIQEQDPKR